jgi:hypothetical protein
VLKHPPGPCHPETSVLLRLYADLGSDLEDPLPAKFGLFVLQQGATQISGQSCPLIWIPAGARTPVGYPERTKLSVALPSWSSLAHVFIRCQVLVCWCQLGGAPDAMRCNLGCSPQQAIAGAKPCTPVYGRATIQVRACQCQQTLSSTLLAIEVQAPQAC